MPRKRVRSASPPWQTVMTRSKKKGPGKKKATPHKSVNTLPRKANDTNHDDEFPSLSTATTPTPQKKKTSPSTPAAKRPAPKSCCNCGVLSGCVTARCPCYNKEKKQNSCTSCNRRKCQSNVSSSDCLVFRTKGKSRCFQYFDIYFIKNYI